MKTIIILLIIAFAFITKIPDVRAQFTVGKKALHAIDFKNEIVYIETKDLSEKQTKRYDDGDFLSSIKTRYNHENELLNKVISDHWYINDKTEKLSDNEISVRIKNKQETWYLRLNRHTDKFFDRKVHKLKKYYGYSHYKLSLYKNKKEIISIPLANKNISKLNLQFALNTLQNRITDAKSFENLHKYINANASLIAGKTLLISDKLTSYSVEYINRQYGGNIKITSEKEILQSIQKKDKRYAYLMITINDFSDKPSFNHFILDCENNKPILINRYTSASIKPCRHVCTKHKYNEKPEFLFDFHFKRYERLINSKFEI